MHTEGLTAAKLATKGLKLLDQILTDFETMSPVQLRGHAKNITDVIVACAKLRAEDRGDRADEREERAFERAFEIESRVVVPDSLPADGPMLEVLTGIHRARLLAGQCTVGELSSLTKLFLSIEEARVALVLKLMGKDSGKDAEEILKMLDGKGVTVEATVSEPVPAPQTPEPDHG